MSRALRATVRFSDDGVFYADDGRFRLWLDVQLHDSLFHRTATALMMNPSTARAENGYLVPDRTVSKLCQFARRELCDRLIVVNVFGVRLTDSRKLHQQQNPVGNPLNDRCIEEAMLTADVRIVAWGRLHRFLVPRADAVRQLLRDVGKPVHALHINDDGSPGHPLYLPAATPLLEFQP